jgi:hypothetical protein
VGMCTNLCKMPSQIFVKESLGMPLNMVPSKNPHLPASTYLLISIDQITYACFPSALIFIIS